MKTDMRKFLTLLESDLKENIANGAVTPEDVKNAAKLAVTTGRIEHRVLYANLKNHLNDDNNE